MNGLLEKTDKEFERDSYGFVFLEIDEESLPRYIETILDISEIKETNLSQFEYDEGLRASDIDNDSPRLVGNQFIDRYSVEPEESVGSDFVDCDALVRNINDSLIRENNFNHSTDRPID
jgi:hypothetical protein